MTFSTHDTNPDVLETCRLLSCAGLGSQKPLRLKAQLSLWVTRRAEAFLLHGFEGLWKSLSLLSKSHQDSLGEQQMEERGPVVLTNSLPRL